jgi:hypothetical protein
MIQGLRVALMNYTQKFDVNNFVCMSRAFAVILRLRRWKRHIASKLRLIVLKELLGVITHEVEILVTTVVIT